jgi:hypothetical protein
MPASRHALRTLQLPAASRDPLSLHAPGAAPSTISDACETEVLDFKAQRARNINSNIPLGAPSTAKDACQVVP